jgi:nucleoside-diphosphate-sugar epimerase
VRQLADRVLALTGSPGPVVQRPLPTDDPRVRRPDITRARELLGWGPVVELDDGLRRTLAYFRERV